VVDDQSQHVEVARNIARSFNSRYGEVLKVPELHVKKEVKRVVGTDGERKMSKSLGNFISIFAEESAIKKQIMGITTDPARIHPSDPGDPKKNPIFNYMELMEYDSKKLKDYKDRYKKGTVGDVEIKKDFFEFFMKYFTKQRKVYKALIKDKKGVEKIMREQAKTVNKVAEKTIKEVRKAIGAR